MEVLSSKLIESVTELGSLISDLVLRLKFELSKMKEVRSVFWTTDQLERITQLIGRYVDLLVKVKKEFGFKEEVEDAVIKEIIWELKALESEGVDVKEKVLTYLKEVVKGDTTSKVD